MRTIKASEFKAKCLQIIDEVAAGEVVVITKRGKPMAELRPPKQKPKTLYGLMKGEIKVLGDIISPIDVKWKALE